ncbi:MAG: flagellar hook-basal body complex protein FliE [Pseudomonadota bacterium]|nr:flagellar hook-basal body complex protein FliE [Pseudomonadota bacterium]
MDGLSIRNISNSVNGIGEFNKLGEKSTSIKGGGGADGKTFASTLKDAMGQVNELQKKADVEMQKLATGKAESIPDVLIAAEKADISLKLMVQVRNKIIDAYNEIMKMQV